jgi:hypothetical protein
MSATAEFLRADIAEVERILKDLHPDRVLERRGFESKLRSMREALALVEEPQDVAPNAPQCSDASSQPTGVTSCGPYLYQGGVWRCRRCDRAAVSGPTESAELAEIVAAVRKGCRPEVAEAILRMVEELKEHLRLDQEDGTKTTELLIAQRRELTKERDDLRAACDKSDRMLLRRQEHIEAQRKEIDDLRAKLAEAEKVLGEDARTATRALMIAVEAKNREAAAIDRAEAAEAKLAETTADYDRSHKDYLSLATETRALRAKLAEAERRDDELCEVINMLKGQEADDTSEIQELKAKLALTEQLRRESDERWVAKLAEAEKLQARTVAELEDEQRGYETASKRAEAAEAGLLDARRRIDELREALDEAYARPGDKCE